MFKGATRLIVRRNAAVYSNTVSTVATCPRAIHEAKKRRYIDPHIVINNEKPPHLFRGCSSQILVNAIVNGVHRQ
jgi:hypothetical protein